MRKLDCGDSPPLPENRKEVDPPAEDVLPSRPHRLEQDVRRELLAHPDLRFSSLVIRRVEDGVCLEGVVEGGEDLPDVCRLVQQVAGVDRVLNHLLVQRPAAAIATEPGMEERGRMALAAAPVKG